ncbi:MAG TPA: hypothetical protein VE053_08335 [Allosphingosinicella sp.]|nr:hypothetical protein [Allosphingosinicella sp.]
MGVSRFRPLAALLLLPGGVAAARERAEPETLPAAPPILKALNDCPRGGSSGDIVVCGRRNDRYRLPIRDEHFDPGGLQESVRRERGRLLEGGEFGIGSCSTVGPGGHTGCFEQQVKRRQQQRAGR